MSLAIAALTGVALAACAGLRVFLPLLAAGIAARWFDWPLAPSMRWLASDPALVTFGVASVVEILADKLPALDHALDVAQTFLAPAAGTMVAVSALGDLPTGSAVALGIITGAPIAGGVHLIAAATRLGSSALTLGTGNPVLSFLEDAAAAVGVVLAFVIPALVVLAVVLLALIVRRWRRSRRASPRAVSDREGTTRRPSRGV
jgi:uncharacterized protein DUF4126